jgi:hypothetical protein
MNPVKLSPDGRVQRSGSPPINSKTTVARGFELGNRNVSRTALRQEVVTLKIGQKGGISSRILSFSASLCLPCIYVVV